MAVEALVVGVVLALLGIAGWAVVRIGLLPLDRMGHTAGQIAGGDLSHRVEATDPRTEVGRLGIALNRMLDRLEEAFTRRKESEDRLRTFIADASHELRTPLASIRGYAELFRMGAVPEGLERERAMRRIEDEAARMGVLVEDLLTLARLDEIADAPHTELDVATLAGDAVDDARATAPDREIGLDARPAAVRGDAHQLRQVLGNLLRNALVHTPAGTPIEVTVEPEPEVVRVSVRDHRPGLPTDDPDCSPRSPPPARRARSTPRSWCPSSTSRPRSSAACAGDNSILRTVLRAAREDRAHRARRPARRGAAGQAGANAAALAITAIADTAANRRLTFRIRGRRDVVRLSADVAADDRLRADGVVDGRRGGRGLREPLLEHGLQRKERVAVEP
jgi:HAMP domain-containing protein